ncbi:caspase family protein [Mitsuaria sp. RG]|nr:caspase family protein [Mitsuaria sp. RG]
MNYFSRLIVLFALISGGSYTMAADIPPRVHALLVGVGNYQASSSAGLAVLKGPPNDVAAMMEVLSERFGLQTSKTTVLLDEKASRSAVLAALRKVMVEEPEPGEVALFYFSGHGSRIYDSSFDESSRFDSTILPYDARAIEGKVLDITDDELGAIIDASRAKGAMPVVILDSCYSGTGIRFLAHAKYAPPVLRSAHASPGRGSSSGSRDIAGGYGTLLAAASDSEEAIEIERGGKVMSEFTRALVGVLRRSEPETTYLDVLTRTRVSMAALGVPHRPQGEGNLQQKFLGTGPLKRPPVLAEKTDDKTATLRIGAATGVTVDSVYDLFASAANAALGASPLATAKVIDVKADTAQVTLTSSSTLPSTMFAIERSHAFGDLKLRIAIDGGNEAERTQLVTALSKFEFVKVTQSDQATHWLQIRNGRTQLTLSDGSTLGMPSGLDITLDDSLAILLGRLAHVQALLGLTNPLRPKSPITTNIYLVSPTEELTKPVIRNGEVHLKAGDLFKVSINNSDAKARHVYLLNISSNLCVRLLSPPPYGVDLPQTALARTKPLRAGPARGREYFFVLDADVPVSLEALQQPCLAQDSLRRVSLQTDKDPLTQLIRNSGSVSRGSIRPLPLTGWSTIVTSMVVE